MIDNVLELLMLNTTARADRVILSCTNWQQFENLLQNLGNNRAARIAYDRGRLEIMTPLPEHEYYKDIISDCIKDIAKELGLDYECYGSATWRRESKQVGVEPDSCFYFQNESRIRGKLKFALEQEPPPDLVLEIDVTSKSLPRFPIYARLEVPEIWCYEQGKLTVYILQREEYQISSSSLVFPDLSVAEIPELIEKYRDRGRRAISQAVIDWVRNQY